MWLQAILSVIAPVIEKVIPDTAQADQLKAEISMAMLNGSQEIERAKAEIIAAEARSESWLTRSWRPIAMLNFLGLLNLYWFGAAPVYLVESPELVGNLFTLLTVGIGGYTAGRSLEKAAGTVAGLMGGRGS